MTIRNKFMWMICVAVSMIQKYTRLPEMISVDAVYIRLRDEFCR